ncbi:hypothetical protein BJ741DRAFT_612419 [Chytriomyces cf. hyalinus JEL632]|nr:hypothetical protein BJ741DRAFT_612419 [Chytriomyces cf. hyalinus JEL632]
MGMSRTTNSISPAYLLTTLVTVVAVSTALLVGDVLLRRERTRSEEAIARQFEALVLQLQHLQIAQIAQSSLIHSLTNDLHLLQCTLSEEAARVAKENVLANELLEARVRDLETIMTSEEAVVQQRAEISSTLSNDTNATTSPLSTSQHRSSSTVTPPRISQRAISRQDSRHSVGSTSSSLSSSPSSSFIRAELAEDRILRSIEGFRKKY